MVSALTTGSRARTAAPAHSNSIQARLAGRPIAQNRVAPQAMNMACTSHSARCAISTGSRRLAQSMPAMPMDRPAMVAMFSRSTSRKPKCGLSGSGSLLRRFTFHSTSPVPTMAVPARLTMKYSQRVGRSPKRPMCSA